MKLYLLELKNEYCRIGGFTSAIVVSASPELANLIHPGGDKEHFKRDWDNISFKDWGILPEHINVTCIGEAESFLEEGQILCSEHID